MRLGHLATTFVLLLTICPPGFAGIGDVDSSFAGEGLYRTPFDSSIYWHQLRASPDGRLLAAYQDSDRIHLYRTSVDGKPDSSFGVEGERVLQAQSGSIVAMGVRPDGSAYLSSNGLGSARLIRVTGQGDPDAAFGHGGLVSIDTAAAPGARSVFIESIAPLADGGVAALVAYYAESFYDDCALQLRVFRWQADGTLHAAYLPNGVSVTQAPSQDSCYAAYTGRLYQMSDGRLMLAAGESHFLLDQAGTVSRWNADLPGTSYLHDDDFPAEVQPSADRRYDYVLRQSSVATRFQVTRLFPDGQVDPDFGGTAGYAQVDIGRAPLGFGSGLRMTGGFIEAARGSGGYIYVALNVDRSDGAAVPSLGVVVVRLRSDGVLDTTFGSQGLVAIPGAYTSGGVLAEAADGSALLQLGSWADLGVVRLRGTAGASAGILTLNTQQSVYGDSLVQEGSTARVAATRSGGSDGAITLSYRTAALTATQGEDYATVSGELRWEDGETGTKWVEVPVSADSLAEPPETFDVRFGSPAGGAALLRKSWHFTIGSTPPAAPPVSTTPVTSSTPGAQKGGGGAVDCAALLGLAGLLGGLRCRRRIRSVLSPHRTIPGSV